VVFAARSVVPWSPAAQPQSATPEATAGVQLHCDDLPGAGKLDLGVATRSSEEPKKPSCRRLGGAVRPPAPSQEEIGNRCQLAWGCGRLEPARERVEVLERAEGEPREACDARDLHLVGAVGAV